MDHKHIVKNRNEEGFDCSCCGKFHTGIPALTFNAPTQWEEEFAKKDHDSYYLSSDICWIDGKDFFIRVSLEIPIIDTDQTFSWGVWVSLKKDNFKKYVEVYGADKELKEKPYFGWFCNQLPGYPKTIGLKTSVHLQGNKLRPLIVLDHYDTHPLCQEQLKGITMERVHEIIENAGININ